MIVYMVLCAKNCAGGESTMSIYDISVDRIDGESLPLAEYEGKVLLIVNTASQCGFTPQYADLQKLYADNHDKGFEILGFPCNQFGKQEPGSNEDIQNFCSLNYQVSFPMFSKIDVNGPNAHPLYQYLKSQARGVMGSQAIKWNFTKFLVNRSGEVAKRYAPSVKPLAIQPDLEALL